MTRNPNRTSRARLASVILALTPALALAGCGGSSGGSNPLGTSSGSSSPSASGSPSNGGSAAVVVGSANFTESQVLGELYAQALKAKGVNASSKPNIGSREVYLKALQQGAISVVPEYTGNLLLNYDKNPTATTAAAVEAALPGALPTGLKILKPSAAADQDVYVVTKKFADANSISSLGDLKKVEPNLVLGGPSELAAPSRARYGPAGLQKTYGVTIKEFKPYDAPAVKIRDLNDNKIQFADFFTTESAITENGYVELKDPKGMILPQNVVPLVSSTVAGNTTATQAIEAVQAALTTADLTALNKKVDSDKDDPSQVAGDWLKSKGLS